MDAETARNLVKNHKWHQNFEIFPGVRTDGSYDPAVWWEWMGIEADIKGARVLDIGTNDGYFALKSWRAGAEVVAIDHQPKTRSGFAIVEHITGMNATFINTNIFDLPSANLGKFDFVLFLGVLYHLPDPYRGLSIVSDLCRGRLLLESVGFALDKQYDKTVPLMRFYPGKTLNGDITNFWAANEAGLLALVEDCGFTVHRTFVNSGNEIHRIAIDASQANKPESALRRRLAYGLRP